VCFEGAPELYDSSHPTALSLCYAYPHWPTGESLWIRDSLANRPDLA